MRLSIGLNIILGLVLGLVAVVYLYEKDTAVVDLESEQQDTKLGIIQPKSKQLIERKDKDIINFLFSVQDFYIHNPQAYEEMIDNIQSLLTLHESIFQDDKLCNYYIQIAESKKANAINAFHSIIYKLPNDKIFTDKFNRADRRLETILTKHINEMYDQCTYVLMTDGYNVLKRPLNKGPKEYNTYFDKDYSYQFY